MTEIVPAQPPRLERVSASPGYRVLLRQLMLLATPVLAEHLLHMLVGLTDTYIANHLPADSAAATAAVGTIAYILWFTGMIIGAIGTGSTAIIARASGARHRSLANSVCGQSMTSALIAGIGLGALMYFAAEPMVALTGLSGQAQAFALSYIRILSFSMPTMAVMFVANACLRGAGDTLTPAITMIVVDIVNIFLSFGLTYGMFGLPQWGFEGIAYGTAAAYVVGGVIQCLVLVHGRGGIKLHLHRLRPHWLTLKRLIRIGIPAGMEGLLMWIANFAIVILINQLDPTSRMAAAHINTIRIESLSFMFGFAIATAAATMVGQSLGMRDPVRATRAAYASFLVGGAFMTFIGLLLIFAGEYPARWLSADAEIANLTRQCIFAAGCVQCAFASAAIFGGALRGAGDTFTVMILNLATILTIRCGGAIFVGLVLRKGLVAIWSVMCCELFIRGVVIYGRFVQGGWKRARV